MLFVVVCYMATLMMLSKTIGEIPNKPKGYLGDKTPKKQHQRAILNETIVCLGFFWGVGRGKTKQNEK